MDACCERICNLLGQDGQSSSRSLAKLVERTGLGRSSVMMYLEHLEGQSLVVKEGILRASVGRPKILYKSSSKLLEKRIQI